MASRISEIISNIKDKPEDYIKAIEKIYNNYIKYSELPVAYQYISGVVPINPKLTQLNDKIDEAVENRYNFLFSFENYNDTGYLASLFINSYFEKCVLSDKSLENILYIDTNLILEDYKRLMNYNDENISPIPVSSLETLYKNIEAAPLVIWNRFTKIKSEYDRNKLYDILLVRQRKNLGNFFFMSDDKTNPTPLDTDLLSLMNIDLTYNCRGRRYLYIPDKEGVEL